MSTKDEKIQCEINDLPDEMLLKILNYLNLFNLVNCRLVSKRFRRWIDTIKLTDLAIISHPFNDVSKYLNKSWFHNKDAIDERNTIDNRGKLDLDAFKEITFDLSTLRRLKLAIPITAINFDFFQTFIESMNCLEHLEIDYRTSQKKLKLPDQLKILFLHSYNPYNYSNLIIDCDSLECFGYSKISDHFIEISNPTNLINLYAYGIVDTSQWFEFENIESLHIYDPVSIDDRNICEIFPNLKEFHFDFMLRDTLTYFDFHGMKLYLLEQKMSMKKETKIYFDGQLVDENFEKFFVS